MVDRKQDEPPSAKGERSDEEPSAEQGSSRRSFLSKNIKRAAYIAPVVWSISARQALGASGDSPIGTTPGPGGGLPDPG